MTKQAPRFLYRYRQLSGEDRERTRKILTDSLIYFTSPTAFKDPFDCKIHFVLTASGAEIRRWYARQVKKRRPGLNRDQRRAKVASDINRLNRTAYIQSITSGLQAHVNAAGILCLSAVNDNVLLWSHYADGHAGLCLQFSAQAFDSRSQPVNYSSAYPKVDPIRDTHERQMEAFLLTKAADWKYEAEWRVIDTGGPGEKRFPRELLRGVILGARMSAEDRGDVVNWVSKRKSLVKLYEAVLRDASFGLDIRPYEP